MVINLACGSLNTYKHCCTDQYTVLQERYVLLKCNPIKVSSSNADHKNQTPGRKTSRRGNFIHKPADNVLSLKPASRSRSRSRSRIRNELASKLNSLIDDDEIPGPETPGTPITKSFTFSPKNEKKAHNIVTGSTKDYMICYILQYNNPY